MCIAHKLSEPYNTNQKISLYVDDKTKVLPSNNLKLIDGLYLQYYPLPEYSHAKFYTLKLVHMLCGCKPYNKQHNTHTLSLPFSEKTSYVVASSSLLCRKWLESCQLVAGSAFLSCEGKEPCGGGVSCGAGGPGLVTPIMYLQEKGIHRNKSYKCLTLNG